MAQEYTPELVCLKVVQSHKYLFICQSIIIQCHSYPLADPGGIIGKLPSLGAWNRWKFTLLWYMQKTNKLVLGKLCTNPSFRSISKQNLMGFLKSKIIFVKYVPPARPLLIPQCSYHTFRRTPEPAAMTFSGSIPISIPHGILLKNDCRCLILNFPFHHELSNDLYVDLLYLSQICLLESRCVSSGNFLRRDTKVYVIAYTCHFLDSDSTRASSNVATVR